MGVSGVDLLGSGGATSFKREGGQERERMMEKAIGQVNGFNIGLGCLFFGLGVRIPSMLLSWSTNGYQ